jgi:hypothetical protein
VFDGQLEERVKCSQCGKEHELLEPSFRRPDAIVGMSPAQRQGRVEEGNDLCIIRGGNGNEVTRCFLRTVLRVEITDGDDYTHWGLWVEVPEAQARRAWELWESPQQAEEPPFAGCVANHVQGYPETIGLPVQVQLTGPTTRPRASFDASVEHPFVVECRQGVTTHKVLEWLAGQGAVE